MWSRELGTQGRPKAEVCQAEICVKLFTPRTSHRGRGGVRERKGVREEDANPNAVPGLCANMGSDGQKKASGGHQFFMRCNGSKANIPFFQAVETSVESKVQNHLPGHCQCILNGVHLCSNWNNMHPCNVDQKTVKRPCNTVLSLFSFFFSYWSFN